MTVQNVTLRKKIAELVRAGLEQALQAGTFSEFELPDTFAVAPSRHAQHGDYASPVCMGLARVLRKAPLQIANALLPHIPAAEYVEKVSVAPPGFINFTLDKTWLAQQVPAILEAGDDWGCVDVGQGARVQVEFVSANPTGPVTIGSARNAVIGDVLAGVLAAAGYAVEREYYVNDAGSKVRHFGGSILSRYAKLFDVEIPFPEKGYPGEYVTTLAQLLAEESGRRYLDMERKEAVAELAHWGIAKMLEGVREDLAQMRVHFDSWRHEKDFYAEGLFEQVMGKLEEGGHVVEHDDATWFRHEDMVKDAVLIRSPQVVSHPEDRPTYLAGDGCYLLDKLQKRNFDRAVYVWGADHHGDVPRVKAMAKALGLDPERLTFILYQLVTLMRSGKVMRMSKSSGEFVSLRELVDEVGPDPVRFMMLMRTVDVTLDFDLDLAVEQSERNPVYYVQYAHTRIAGVLRKAADFGFDATAGGDPTLLVHPSELALIRKMMALAEIISVAATNCAPHHLTTYASELAAHFHAFYRDCRIVDPDNADLTRARLMLARAAKSVLARVLRLIGVGTPEQM